MSIKEFLCILSRVYMHMHTTYSITILRLVLVVCILVTIWTIWSSVNMLLFVFVADLLLIVGAQTSARFDFPPDYHTLSRLLSDKDVQYLQDGFDTTKSPYNAAGDGKTDDRVALQEAVEDAYHSRMSVVLPAGRVFLLSRQLTFRQHNRSRTLTCNFFAVPGRCAQFQGCHVP